MATNSKNLQYICLCCLGLFAGTSICMKMLESEFIFKDEKFSIIGLELTYSREKVAAILAGIDPIVKSALRYQLYFDFIFMFGVYPGIATLCLMARNKAESVQVKKVLCLLATLQLMAWVCDILENYSLLKWINHPFIGNEFMLYHFIVVIKWMIALTGAACGIYYVLRKFRMKERKPEY
jgi:hypothetical protein